MLASSPGVINLSKKNGLFVRNIGITRVLILCCFVITVHWSLLKQQDLDTVLIIKVSPWVPGAARVGAPGDLARKLIKFSHWVGATNSTDTRGRIYKFNGEL